MVTSSDIVTGGPATEHRHCWLSSNEGDKLKHPMESTGKMGATHCSEDVVGGAGEASEARGVDDAVGVVLVASQVVAGSEVPRSCGVRRDISVTRYFPKSRYAESTDAIVSDLVRASSWRSQHRTVCEVYVPCEIRN